MMKPATTVMFTLLLATFTLSSCRERGCTNPAAINYNVTADEDDGSCIVCKTNLIPLDTVTSFIIDEQGGSIHYMDTIVRVYLYQDVSSYSDLVCGKPVSNISIKLKSLVPEKMFLYYLIRDVLGPINIYLGNDVLIDPYAELTDYTTVIDNYPPFLEISLDSIKCSSQNTVIYY